MKIGARTPAAIDVCLSVADELDVQVAIHTDTLNESGFVEDTIAAIGDRTIHTLSLRGCGRRSRAGYYEGVFLRERLAFFDQSDATLHRQYFGRAPRYVDGVPSLGLQDSGGCRFCGVTDSAADDCGRKTCCMIRGRSR